MSPVAPAIRCTMQHQWDYCMRLYRMCCGLFMCELKSKAQLGASTDTAGLCQGTYLLLLQDQLLLWHQFHRYRLCLRLHLQSGAHCSISGAVVCGFTDCFAACLCVSFVAWPYKNSCMHARIQQAYARALTRCSCRTSCSRGTGYTCGTSGTGFTCNKVHIAASVWEIMARGVSEMYSSAWLVLVQELLLKNQSNTQQ